MAPEQWSAGHYIIRIQQLVSRKIVLKIHNVPGHVGVEDNEQADRAAKEVAGDSGDSRYPDMFTSLAHTHQWNHNRQEVKGCQALAQDKAGGKTTYTAGMG